MTHVVDNELEKALQVLASSDIISAVDASGVRDMIRHKEQERRKDLVLEKHLNKQGDPYTITEVNYSMRGKPVTRWATSAPWKGKTAKILKNSYNEVIEELYEHYFPDNDRLEDMTLQKAFEAWKSKRERSETVSSMTLERYESDWNHYLKGITPEKKGKANTSIIYKRCDLLDKRVTDIKASEIREIYEYLIGNEKMTKKAFYNVRGLIIGAFSYAFNQGINCIDVSRVSFDGLHFKEPKDNSEAVYTPDEREQLLNYLESLPDQDVYTLSVRLAFTLCIRIAELRALTWDDIDTSDPSRPIIRICHQIVDKATDGVQRRATEVDYMKSHSRAGKRSFPLSPYAMSVLEQLHKLNPDSKYICTNKGGENSIYTNRFNEKLKSFCEGAGIRYLSSHKIRFYAVSQMYDMGVDEKVIMALAGHSNVSTTRHYNRKIREISLSEEQLSLGFGRKNA